MNRTIEAGVLIVGAGSVGLTLAAICPVDRDDSDRIAQYASPGQSQLLAAWSQMQVCFSFPDTCRWRTDASDPQERSEFPHSCRSLARAGLAVSYWPVYYSIER